MTPEQRSDLIGSILVVLAVLWLAPILPTAIELLQVAWRNANMPKDCGKPGLEVRIDCYPQQFPITPYNDLRKPK